MRATLVAPVVAIAFMLAAVPAAAQKPDTVGEIGEWRLMTRMDPVTGRTICYLANETDTEAAIHISSVQKDIMANNGKVLSKRSEYRIDDGDLRRVRTTFEHHSVIIDDASQLLGANRIEIVFDVWHDDPDRQIFELDGIDKAWEWLSGSDCAKK